MSANQNSLKETVKVQSELVAGKVKELIHEGNVRRVTVRNEQGHTVIEIPVTAGVIAAVAAPVLVGVAAIAALASSWEIEVDRVPESAPGSERSEPSLQASSR